VFESGFPNHKFVSLSRIVIFAEFCASVFAVVEGGDGIGQGLVMELIKAW
jgi:hypothetical protein